MNFARWGLFWQCYCILIEPAAHLTLWTRLLLERFYLLIERYVSILNFINSIVNLHPREGSLNIGCTWSFRCLWPWS